MNNSNAKTLRGATPVDEAAVAISSDWARFLNESHLSVRVLNVLNNANIQTLQELTSKTARQMLMYRNFGPGGLTQLRLALGRRGQSLAGDPVYSPVELTATDDLWKQLRLLQQRREETLVQIQQVKAAIAASRPPKAAARKDPHLEQKIVARWKKVLRFAPVAKDLGITIEKVRAVIMRRLR